MSEQVTIARPYAEAAFSLARYFNRVLDLDALNVSRYAV